MGWMSEIEGAASHKGQVVVTKASGASSKYLDIPTAEAACGDLKGKLHYFRGAFFEAGASRRADAVKAPKAEAPKAEAPKEDKSSRRRRRSSEDDA